MCSALLLIIILIALKRFTLISNSRTDDVEFGASGSSVFCSRTLPHAHKGQEMKPTSSGLGAIALGLSYEANNNNN